MKHIATLFAALIVCCSPSCSQAAPPQTATSAYPAEYVELLKTYVKPEGVRYAAWHANQADLGRLKKVTEFFASTAPPTDRNASFAWHINAYNAWILNAILAKYPTKGPMEGGNSFFQGDRIVVSGKKTSFNDLEQKAIRPTFHDPRVHFALNCASRSCPPLQGKPFDPGTLDEDLNRLARAFINNDPVVSKNDQVVRLSKIFDWYADDFGGKGNQAAFINRFREQPLPAGAKFEFMDYDWNLNAMK